MGKSGKRDQIVALKEVGLTNKRISKQLNVSIKTVYNVLKRFKETASTATKSIPGRKRSVRTKRLVDTIRKKVSRNPRRSIRQMAKDLKVSRRTVGRVVKEGLGLTSYKMQRRHLISSASKAKRLDRTKKMLEEMRSAGDKVFIWSDEKIFTVEPQINQQNDRVLAASSSCIDPAVRTVYRRQKPAGVMVWAAVASDGTKSPLVFIKEGVKVNSQVYLKMLEEQVLTWVTESFPGGYVFTQDGAPSHTSNVTQQWCKSHFKGFWDKNMWPPSSPDINPMDFAIWSILESDVCAGPHSSTAVLRQALENAWSNISEDTVRRSCQSVVKRLEAVVKAKGGHIES